MTSKQARELLLSGKLPPGTTIEDWLDLDGCTSLQSLPNDLKVEGYLDLFGCTSLQALPDGLMVERWLDLEGCTSLQSLPKGLKVEGELNLYGCTSLQSLPDGLKVEGYLNLYGCTSLQLPYGIPEGVKGEVWVDEEVLRNNKDHLLMLVNCRFSEESKVLYKKMLAEG